MKDVIANVRLQLDANAKKNMVNVIRSDVLDGVMRAVQRVSFNPKAELNVHFVGEDGIDQGGPRRECMSLTMRAIENLSLFAGTCGAKGKHLTMNSKGL